MRSSLGNGLSVGIDIDGVIADHVTPLLDRINLHFGTSLTVPDVQDWNPAVGDSDFLAEILLAARDREYVHGMEPIPGAAEAIQTLRGNGHKVILLTTRPMVARPWTTSWLDRHSVRYDRLRFVREAARKGAAVRTHLLVEDRPETLDEYVSTTPGIGVLLRQPWNSRTWDAIESGSSGRLLAIRQMSDLSELIASDAVQAQFRMRR